LKNEIYANPNAPEVKLILYMYSMEPPFYAELNAASRKMDQSQLQSLGPFAKALYGILTLGSYSNQLRASVQ